MKIHTKHHFLCCSLLGALVSLFPAFLSAQVNDAVPKDGDHGTPAGSEVAKVGSAPNATPSATAAESLAGSFVIGTDDVLAVSVWKEPDISRSVPVRSDGKISLPLVGEVQASGQTPRQLEEEIAAKLQNYISEPDVTVIVQEIRSQRFNILGQVNKPGSYTLINPTTVLDAIAMAGGFRDFAKQKSIYVLRAKADGRTSRIPFNYKQVIEGKNSDQNIKLESRDTVFVP
jgi:polysaccharide export outer membrane protein